MYPEGAFYSHIKVDDVERQRNGYHSRGKRGLFHALMIAGGKVIPNQRQHALRHAARHAVRKHIHLLGNAKAGLHCRAVCGHKVIEHGEGYVFAQRHKAGWQANAQNLAHYVLIERILIQREAGLRAIRNHLDIACTGIGVYSIGKASIDLFISTVDDLRDHLAQFEERAPVLRLSCRSAVHHERPSSFV